MNHWHITEIPSLQDNYIWVMHDCYHALVFDPGESSVVIDFLEKEKLLLLSILLTHHHADHTGGVVDLVKLYGSVVYCPPDPRFPSSYNRVSGGLDFSCGHNQHISFQIIPLPGHTRSHIAYYSEPLLFCGDVLFAGGCGRVFEGTHKQMLDSLMLLANLPDETKVFCAHEYTQNNLRFAQLVEPYSKDLIDRVNKVDKLRKEGKPTVPSTILEEKLTNPFLRCDCEPVRKFSQEISGTPCNTALEVFSALRIHKDQL
ncbi:MULTISPECIES: hydroxyacylglutathione hydrolase [Candidatus Ichthyocystis]|uniref:hydroxyacylglutathione hydrolase n=1 Tax=Candidatus Ichthyocystis TaxID=2929841 RepID=UPI000A954709|nr:MULTISPECIES: hydroxyacylglutathione hydrolase [Ichthyocystis]